MLGLIEEGAKAFARGRRTWHAPKGSVSVVNAGELHTGYRLAGDELRYRAIYVPLSILADAAECGPPVNFQSGVIFDPALFAELIAAHDSILGGDLRLAREHALLGALGRLARRHGDRAPTAAAPATARPEVARVRAILDEQYACELAIGDLAASVGLSSFFLMRRFREEVGLPIHAYQIQRRIEEAKRLLAQGAPIVETALQVGFADQSHFTKRFKSVVGATPAVYQHGVRS